MRPWPRWMRIVNKRLLQLQEKFIRNQHVLGLPFYLTLESGNICNLRCPLCATTFREKDLPRGTLNRFSTVVCLFSTQVLSRWARISHRAEILVPRLNRVSS